MYIYEIVNKQNGKRYIGQTIHRDIKQRWDQHIYRLNTERHENSYLQRSWRKWGQLNFTFHIIELCENKDVLDAAEIKWISHYRTTNRKYGYNILDGGCNSNSHDGRRKISKMLRPEGYPDVVDSFGTLYSIDNLREFARVHKLTQFGLRKVVVTKQDFHYKGWRLATHETIGIPFKDDDFMKRGNRISSARLKERYPDVISPEGTIYNVENLSKFCREHGLSKSNMSQLLRGKKLVYKGWCIKQP